jgi:hypothetical protein
MPLTTFPVGVYSIAAFLYSTKPSCTPVPATWRCYPYTLYSTSQSGSQSTFNWIIAGTNSSSGLKYTISATDNPFALPFTNATLTLQERGTQDEHWGFSTTLPKVVYPDEVITADGSTARCYYNQSMVSGNLYTRRNATLGGGANEDDVWPGAVEIWQTADMAPTCFEVLNGNDGEKVQLTGASTSGMCQCMYADFQS